MMMVKVWDGSWILAIAKPNMVKNIQEWVIALDLSDFQTFVVTGQGLSPISPGNWGLRVCSLCVAGCTHTTLLDRVATDFLPYQLPFLKLIIFSLNFAVMCLFFFYLYVYANCFNLFSFLSSSCTLHFTKALPFAVQIPYEKILGQINCNSNKLIEYS